MQTLVEAVAGFQFSIWQRRTGIGECQLCLVVGLFCIVRVECRLTIDFVALSCKVAVEESPSGTDVHVVPR